nr:immunoglobulin light chain junction region [Macaca mulatta]MOW55046.1 immunoglobulin light chain junction region [Macaca mulatta]
CQHCYDAPFTF